MTRTASKIAVLKAEIAKLEALEGEDHETRERDDGLSLPEYRRYGRQMILDGFGLEGQLRLKKASILVVGAGGLGCPVLQYLAGAGVGSIDIVDHDTVELSNLHRQILHTEARIGLPKAQSAKLYIRERNPSIRVKTHLSPLTPQSIYSSELDFLSFDLVLDCTDNAATRYLLNDACVAHDKVLLSGAAIRMDGQVVLWNLPPSESETRGPCYRCVFPETPSATQDSQNCEDEGVMGSVTGVIGTLMASEAIKYLVGLHDLKPALTIYSALSNPPFRTLKIRGKKQACPACSGEGASTLLQKQIEAEEAGQWSISVCGAGENVPEGDERMSAANFADLIKSNPAASLLDVRPNTEYGICALPNSQNIPLAQLLKEPQSVIQSQDSQPITVVCRRGNDSIVAARALREAGIPAKDLVGGLRSWSAVDPTFPIY